MRSGILIAAVIFAQAGILAITFFPAQAGINNAELILHFSQKRITDLKKFYFAYASKNF